MNKLYGLGLLICLLILSLPGHVWGNRFEIAPWTLSINFGAASSDQQWEVEGGDTSAIREKNGPQFSIYLDYKLKPYLSLVSGIRLVEKGLTYDQIYYNEYGYQCGSDYFEEVIGYISIPILFKLKHPTDRVTPYLFLGPRIDLKVYTDSSFEYIGDLYDEFKNPILGYDVGGGISFRVFKTCSIYLEVSMSEDLMYAYDKEGLKAKNKVTNILLGVEILKF